MTCNAEFMRRDALYVPRKSRLLEHLYRLSLDYVYMLLGSREQRLPVIDATWSRYETDATALPLAARDARLFREGEIRCSLEMAPQANAQGITNEPAAAGIPWQ